MALWVACNACGLDHSLVVGYAAPNTSWNWIHPMQRSSRTRFLVSADTDCVHVVVDYSKIGYHWRQMWSGNCLTNESSHSRPLSPDCKCTAILSVEEQPEPRERALRSASLGASVQGWKSALCSKEITSSQHPTALQSLAQTSGHDPSTSGYVHDRRQGSNQQ